ncbi:MAG: FAD-dependent oxidoreductase [Bauldia sp.]
MRVIVIGAGVSGVLTAYRLTKAGCEVMVVDRAAGPAAETSFANGGVIGGTQIEPWASPGLQWKLLKWIGREDAPLLVRWRELPRMVGWGLAFLRNCTTARFHRNLAASGRLTRHSLACFARLRDEAGLDGSEYALIRRGALKLYLSRETFDAAAAESETIAKLGFGVSPVDAAECVRREPGLGPAAHTIAGGVAYDDEEIGDCRAFTLAMAERARAGGAVFRFGTPVWGLRRSGDAVAAMVTRDAELTADAYVLATASYSAGLLRGVGVSAPVIPTKGLTITVPAAPWPDAVRSAVMDHSRIFGLIRIGDNLRVSGSAEITGHDTTPSDRRCDAILANVLELFPDFRACLGNGQKRWAGNRGNTPDGPPILGATPLRNLFLNIGHGPQGWSTSAGAADIVADIVLGRSPAIELDGLTLDRFA